MIYNFNFYPIFIASVLKLEQGGAPDPLTELLATASVFSHTQVLLGPGCRRTSFPLPGAEAPASGAGWGVVLCTLRGSLKAGPDPHTPPVKALGRTRMQSGLPGPHTPPGKALGRMHAQSGRPDLRLAHEPILSCLFSPIFTVAAAASSTCSR